MSGRGQYQHCNCASFLGGGDVSWILNKVVVAQVAKGNMALMVYRPIGLAYMSQGVTITYLVLLAELIAVGNMDRGDYCEGMFAALRSIRFLSSRLLSTNI
jgi:Na+/melibiose symporter-like transporter